MAIVSYPHDVLAKLRRWGMEAVGFGLRTEFTTALREMEMRLQTDPESWGDPLRDFRGLRLTLYRHYGPVFVVIYAVHIDGTPVFVKDIRLTAGSLLADLLG